MKTKLLAALLLGGIAMQPAKAVELVRNGSFETGDLSGFTDSSEPRIAFVSSRIAHTGRYGYLNAMAGHEGVIEQTVATHHGQSYTYSFWLESDGTLPNKVTVKLGRKILVKLTNAGAFGYTRYTGTVAADGDNDVLSFAFRNDNSAFGLDDVSLTPVVAISPVDKSGR